MNRMELVPSHASDWHFVQRLERLGRCAHLTATKVRLEQARAELLAAKLASDELATRLAFVNAVARKLNYQHEEAHLCFPFSRN